MFPIGSIYKYKYIGYILGRRKMTSEGRFAMQEGMKNKWSGKCIGKSKHIYIKCNNSNITNVNLGF